MLQSYSTYFKDQVQSLESEQSIKKAQLAEILSSLDDRKSSLLRVKKIIAENFKKCAFENKVIEKKISIHRSSSFKELFENDNKLTNKQFKRSLSEGKENIDSEPFNYFQLCIKNKNKKKQISENELKDSDGENSNRNRDLTNITDIMIRKRTISVILNNFRRTPSILLKSDYDIIYVNGILTYNGDDMNIWEKNIVSIIKNKVSKNKIRKEIKSFVKKFIPSSLRGLIWPIVKLFLFLFKVFYR